MGLSERIVLSRHFLTKLANFEQIKKPINVIIKAIPKSKKATAF